MRYVIEFPLEGLRDDGEPIPPPRNRVGYVEVAAWQPRRRCRPAVRVAP